MPTKMTKAEGGLLGARRRWGEMPRVARLDSLSLPIQEAVLALIRADQESKQKAAPDAARAGTAEVTEGHPHVRPAA